MRHLPSLVLWHSSECSVSTTPKPHASFVKLRLNVYRRDRMVSLLASGLEHFRLEKRRVKRCEQCPTRRHGHTAGIPQSDVEFCKRDDPRSSSWVVGSVARWKVLVPNIHRQILLQGISLSEKVDVPTIGMFTPRSRSKGFHELDISWSHNTGYMLGRHRWIGGELAAATEVVEYYRSVRDCCK